MCGIVGWVGTPWQPYASQAIAALKSRGPDAQTLKAIAPALLGHTRLAVIDLATGQQPMSTPDGRYTIIFNGEIYNYQELRQQLSQCGVVFQTHSDTEVLLYGYSIWGKDVLAKLDGMFAFAIWDMHTQELFAARDPLGIKPLMYAQDKGLMLASTLAPFLAIPNFPRKINLKAVRDYLAFQTPLAPHTFCQAVKQLPPAHYLHYQAHTDTLKIEQYWHIPLAPKQGLSFTDAVEATDQAIRLSVQRQLVADVPLGAFLSGGIDSSLLAFYMTQALKTPLKTFSLTFQQQAFDESSYARQVAQQLGCEHYELPAPELGVEQLVKAISDLDQPLADPAYVMTHTLAQLTREHVTVTISGDGGDELFAGYERYFQTEDQYPAQFWQPTLQALIKQGVLPSSLWSKSLSGQERLAYQRGELGAWPKGRKAIQSYFKPQWHAQAELDQTLGLWGNLLESLGGKMETATLMRADLWTYLSENCLVKTDRASMAHGLEVRVPLLGKPVLDLALSLPIEVHQIGGTKPILTALAQRYLPNEVWNRPKHGFSVPLQALFQGAWRQECEDLIRHADILAPALNSAAIQVVWQQALTGKASRRLAYTFIVLLMWLKAHPMEW